MIALLFTLFLELLFIYGPIFLICYCFVRFIALRNVDERYKSRSQHVLFSDILLVTLCVASLVEVWLMYSYFFDRLMKPISDALEFGNSYGGLLGALIAAKPAYENFSIADWQSEMMGVYVFSFIWLVLMNIICLPLAISTLVGILNNHNLSKKVMKTMFYVKSFCGFASWLTFVYVILKAQHIREGIFSLGAGASLFLVFIGIISFMYVWWYFNTKYVIYMDDLYAIQKQPKAQAPQVIYVQAPISTMGAPNYAGKATKTCPYCGETILAVASKCKYCGEWLDKVPETRKVECPVCGEEIDEGTQICPFCHENVTTQENADAGTSDILVTQNNEIEQPKQPLTKICPICCEEIPYESEICPMCNEKCQ